MHTTPCPAASPPSRADLLVAWVFFTLEPFLGLQVAEERARNLVTATMGLANDDVLSPTDEAREIAEACLSSRIPTIAALLRSGRLDEAKRREAIEAATGDIAEHLRREAWRAA